MVLLLSENSDFSTSFVIDWLLHEGISFNRLNGDDDFVYCNISLSSTGQLSIELVDRFGELFNFDDYACFWYRRGDYRLVRPILKNKKKQVSNILDNEWQIVRDFIHQRMKLKPHIGDINIDTRHNKLTTLLLAASVGLKIPNTIISNKFTELEKFHDKSNRNTITKAIWNMFRLTTNKIFFQTIGTKKVSNDRMLLLGKWFFPTLLQDNIEKSYELRVFFLGRDLYSMAIFSQNDPKTQIDFRNYNVENPNRCIPFALPQDVNEKILKLVELLKMDTGSIDIIVTPSNEFVFLEINHLGQFGWVSNSCNYYLEEKIAKHFKSISVNNETYL